MQATYVYAARTPTTNVTETNLQFLAGFRYRYDLALVDRRVHFAVHQIKDPYLKASRLEWERRKAAGEEDPRTKVQLSEEDAAAVEHILNDAKAERKALSNASKFTAWGTRGWYDNNAARALISTLKKAPIPKKLKEGQTEADRVWKTVGPPHLSSWDGSGAIACQLQGGLAVSELLAGTDTQVQLVGEGEHRLLYFRIGSDEHRQPIFTTFPVIYHRPLPAEARIKLVVVIRRRVGLTYKLAVHFVLDDVTSNGLPEATKGCVGVDIGWRLFDDRLRVAVWHDSEGNSGELSLPHHPPEGRLDKHGVSHGIYPRWQYTEGLRSLRDQLFNGARADLCAARKERGGSWPGWLLRATEHAHAWKAATKLYRLVLRWINHRGMMHGYEGEPQLFERLDAWRRREEHLYQWEAHQRENVLAARREIYRLFALQMAQYARVAVEDMDLREFAEKPDEDEGDEPDEAITADARERRFKVALSQLRDCIKSAVMRSTGDLCWVNPRLTTKRCWSCGTVNEFDAAHELRHTCSGCGKEWDQDHNAAINLLNAGMCGEYTSERAEAAERHERLEKAKTTRREKSLTTRRANGAARRAEREREQRDGGGVSHHRSQKQPSEISKGTSIGTDEEP